MIQYESGDETCLEAPKSLNEFPKNAQNFKADQGNKFLWKK